MKSERMFRRLFSNTVTREFCEIGKLSWYKKLLGKRKSWHILRYYNCCLLDRPSTNATQLVRLSIITAAYLPYADFKCDTTCCAYCLPAPHTRTTMAPAFIHCTKMLSDRCNQISYLRSIVILSPITSVAQNVHHQYFVLKHLKLIFWFFLQIHNMRQIPVFCRAV